MAAIKRKLLGDISGKLGDSIYRQRNGKVVAYSRPAYFNISQSENAKKGRSRFALNVMLARTLVAVPRLKEIWTSAQLKGAAAYNRIIKYNAHLTASDNLTAKNIITPAGIPFYITHIELGESELLFTPELNKKLLSEIHSSSFYIYAAFYFYNSVSTDAPGPCFTILEEEQTIPSLGNISSLKINTNDEVIRSRSLYSNLIIYIALSAQKPIRKKVYWTTTFAREISLPVPLL